MSETALSASSEPHVPNPHELFHVSPEPFLQFHQKQLNYLIMDKESTEPEAALDVSYMRQLKDLAMGEHPLFSRWVPPLLLLADALLTSVIISKVSCESTLHCPSSPITN